MRPTESIIQRVSGYMSTVSHLSIFIPWVEMQRIESLNQIDGLLDKLVPAVEGGERVWIEQADPDAPRREIPHNEVVEGVEMLRRHKRLAARYPAMVMDMSFVYLCAAYDAYFQDYLVSFILAQPSCLRSKRQLTYERILEQLEAGTLLQYLAQREAHELGYKSFDEQIQYLRDRLGVKLSPDEADIPLLQEAVAVRNLIMHNDGVVNEIFLEGSGGRGDYVVGHRVEITATYWARCRDSFSSLVIGLTEDLLCRIYKLDPAEAAKLLREAAA